MSNPRQKRSKGATVVHFSDMRTQADPKVVEKYRKKLQRRMVTVRILKRVEQKKVIDKIRGDRKIAQWEIICDTKNKYYVLAVNRENAIKNACRNLRIHEDSILSAEVYNAPPDNDSDETQEAEAPQQQGAAASQEREDGKRSQAYRQEIRDPK